MNGRPEAALRTERRAGIYVGHLGDLLGDLGAQRAGCSGDLGAQRAGCSGDLAARRVACAARMGCLRCADGLPALRGWWLAQCAGYCSHDKLGDLGAQRAGYSGDLAARRVACAARMGCLRCAGGGSRSARGIARTTNWVIWVRSELGTAGIWLRCIFSAIQSFWRRFWGVKNIRCRHGSKFTRLRSGDRNLMSK
jgi:hypothetical protein